MYAIFSPQANCPMCFTDILHFGSLTACGCALVKRTSPDYSNAASLYGVYGLLPVQDFNLLDKAVVASCKHFKFFNAGWKIFN